MRNARENGALYAENGAKTAQKCHFSVSLQGYFFRNTAALRDDEGGVADPSGLA
jgi:hypothetical protein